MIRSISPRPAVFAALSISLFAAACGDSADHSDAVFSTADDAHLDRSLSSLAAGDLGSLYVIGVFVAGANQTGCPAMATTGAVTTITGGCTTDDGVLLGGRIVITNIDGGFTPTPAYNPSQPGTVEAFDWNAKGATGPADSLDGKVTVVATGGIADNGATLSGTVDVVADGIGSHADLGFTCDTTDLCTFADDSWFEVDAVGAATVAGTFRFDDPRTGSITAVGAETLVLDVAGSTDDCRVFQIDGGARRERCAPAQKLRQGPAAADRWLAAMGR